MRVLFVWVTAIIVLFIVTVGWYISSQVVVTIASQAMTGLTGRAFSLLTLVEYVAAWWGPILDVVVLIWAILNSQEIDPNSRAFAY